MGKVRLQNAYAGPKHITRYTYQFPYGKGKVIIHMVAEAKTAYSYQFPYGKGKDVFAFRIVIDSALSYQFPYGKGKSVKTSKTE